MISMIYKKTKKKRDEEILEKNCIFVASHSHILWAENVS